MRVDLDGGLDWIGLGRCILSAPPTPPLLFGPTYHGGGLDWVAIHYHPLLILLPAIILPKQALLTALGLMGVQTINKKWAKGLSCLTDKDIKDIPFSTAPGHYEGYR